MHLSLGYALLVLTVFTLAVARVTRLINADTILDKPRLWLAGRARHHRLIASELQAHISKAEAYDHHRELMGRWNTAMYFIQCPWCVSMWVALAAAWLPVWLIGWPWWALIPVGLAISHLVGISARFADTEDISIEDDNAE